MKENILNELFELIAKRCHLKKEDLELETEIFKDIGCSGDDAFDLIEYICEKYNINCKEFNPSDVCDSEGNNYLKSILNPKYLYKSIFDKEKTEFPSFTIQILLKAIETKKLKSLNSEGYYYAKEVIVGE